MQRSRSGLSIPRVGDDTSACPPHAHRPGALSYGAGVRPNRFERFATAIRGLPPGRLSRERLLDGEFLLTREGRLSVYYIPFERTNPKARVMLVGITPGWTQMQLAFETARDALHAGVSRKDVFRAVEQAASFAGPMRSNLVRMLDALQLPSLLGIPSSASLFAENGHLLDSTSALRDPVFVDGRNYTGSSPSIDRSPLLLGTILDDLGVELSAAPDAIVIPLGGAVEKALAMLVKDGQLDAARCCLGFPHPSGANGHRARLFEENRVQLGETMSRWFA